MGDNYFLKLNCASCGEENPKQTEDTEHCFWEENYLSYAPSCGNTDFKCWKCGKNNEIVQVFKAEKNEI